MFGWIIEWRTLDRREKNGWKGGRKGRRYEGRRERRKGGREEGRKVIRNE